MMNPESNNTLRYGTLVYGSTIVLFLLLLSCGPIGHDRADQTVAGESSDVVHYTYRVAGGEVVLMYKLQTELAQQINRSGLADSSIVDTLYNLNQRLWTSCLIDSPSSFRKKYGTALQEKSDAIIALATEFEALGLDSIILTTFENIAQQSSVPFEGRYLIGFLENVGCLMCGCDNYTMVGNAYNEVYTHPDQLKILLAHEINHNFYETAKQEDPDKNTVLYNALDEGFANLFSMQVTGASRLEAFGMSPQQYQWLTENEDTLRGRFKQVMFSTKEEDWDPFSQKIADSVVQGSPGDVGYFIGYRIIEAWLDRNPARTWQDVYDVPVRTIIEESGYLD